MNSGRDRREREKPLSMLPDMKNISPEFAGIFLVIAVIFIIFLYWKPFSSDDNPVKNKESQPSSQNLPVPLKSPSDTVLIMEQETGFVPIGEFACDYNQAEIKLTQIRDYFNDSRIALDEYKKGSILKSEWMSDTKSGVAVRLAISYDAADSKIIIAVHEKRADESLKAKIDSRAVAERIIRKFFFDGKQNN